MEKFFNDNFPGDWDKPTPVRTIQDDPILLEMGKVAVAFDGTIWINGHYDIAPDRLRGKDWILHLTEKLWFDTDMYEDFKRCYYIACKLSGQEPTHQIRSYHEIINKKKLKTKEE